MMTTYRESIFKSNKMILVLKTILILASVTTTSHCVQVTDFYSYYNLPDTYGNMTECKLALANFAKGSSEFTLCSIHYSHPIHICEMCVDPYMDVVSAHNTIMTLEVNGTKCKDKLINVDRLEVVETTFSNIKDLWDRGHCDKCFDWNDGKPTLSYQTITFIKYFNKTKECINNHINNEYLLQDNDTDLDTVCIDCMDNYLELNSYYESLKGNHEITGICIDIVDSMNATRSVWSGVLNCCRLRRKPEIIFLICTGIFALLPILFYSYAKIYCQSSDRIQVTGQHQYEDTVPCIPSTSELSDGDTAPFVSGTSQSNEDTAPCISGTSQSNEDTAPFISGTSQSNEDTAPCISITSQQNDEDSS